MVTKAKTSTNVKKKSRVQHLIDGGHLIKKGQVLNPAGRTKGSKNKLSESFLAALHEDFEQYGAFAIADCRTEDPARYCAIIASLVPKDFSLNNNEDHLLEKFLEQFTTVEEIREFRKQLGHIAPTAQAPE